MQKLSPALPLDPDETALSWACHLAALHTRGPLGPFLNDFGISVSATLGGKADAFERLAEVTGECEEKVLSSAVLALNRTTYRFRGEPVSARFLVGRSVRFCPQCVLEDRLSGGSRARSPRYRPAWESNHVRVCELHALPLITRKDCSNRELAALTESNAGLERLASATEPRAPSALQTYILSRLGLSRDPREKLAWMDGQPVDQAVRATEMLGVLLEFGPKHSLRTLSQAEWDVAGEAGWEFTRRGPAGIHAALEMAHGRYATVRLEHLPGRVFHGFHFFVSNANWQPGSIRDVALDYYRSAMALCPRRECLGKVLRVRQRHSIATLSALSKVPPHDVLSILTEAGIAFRRVDGPAPDLMTFDANAAERALLSARNLIFLDEASDILGASRETVEVLANEKRVEVVNSVPGTNAWTDRAVSREKINALRVRIENRFPVVDQSPPGFLPLQAAHETAGRDFREILTFFIDGRLQHSVRLHGKPGLDGVMIDPRELAWLTSPDPKVVTMTAGFRRLRVPPAVGRLLMSTEHGAPFLPSVNMAKAPWFDENLRLREDGIREFERTFATLLHLSRETGHRKGKIRSMLLELGIKPVVPPSQIGVELFRRSDLPEGWMD